jgi:hypothetical protein
VKGGTLIVVGHVEANSFVVSSANGETTADIPIPDLVKMAIENGVLLIPLGCEIAKAGAPLGFIHNINAGDIQEFLVSLPRDNATIGDVFVGLDKIGELHTDGSELVNILEVAVFQEYASVPATRIRFPRTIGMQPTAEAGPPSPGPSSQLPSFEKFAANLEQEAETLERWSSKKWRRFVSRYRWPFIGIVGFGGLWLSSAIANLEKARWLYKRRWRLGIVKLLQILGPVIHTVSLVMIAGGVAWCITQRTEFALLLLFGGVAFVVANFFFAKAAASR